ncbi:aldolase/citrate lyase family protein [Methylobacterium gossipiicola]|uniref:4-hydroxy-2-oxoheptanedioate aldolase n=1 Tax=Methylobacterium gossipiicola TaxID=582675 RepID=A0A1I2XPU4_9HYPH|nr:aldolase/citrate lyase family protein [Methylobacterium gossipiicola]SFH15528.1 4-hydroxy-2-oxoheptanedioate aldolase [Methylobacterium gossipiicola]
MGRDHLHGHRSRSSCRKRAGIAGFDFVLIDLEHTLIHGIALEQLLAAADRAGLSALVRVPEARSDRILPCLDAGAAGIVIPRVGSVADAEAAVVRARHAPRGRRGVNAGPLGRYGEADLPALPARLDAETLVIAMIEDPNGDPPPILRFSRSLRGKVTATQRRWADSRQG